MHKSGPLAARRYTLVCFPLPDSPGVESNSTPISARQGPVAQSERVPSSVTPAKRSAAGCTGARVPPDLAADAQRQSLRAQLSMDANLHVNEQMDEAQSLHGRTREDSLLNKLTETIQGIEADRRSRVQHKETVRVRRCIGEEPGRGREERMPRPAKDEKEDEGRGTGANEEQVEKECKQKVLGVLKQLSVFHSERVTAWRDVLRECASMLNKSRPEPDCKVMPRSDSFSDTFQSVGEDIDNIMQKLSTIVTKLDAEILQLAAEKASSVDAALQETIDPETSVQPEDGNNHLSSHDPHESDSGRTQEFEVEGDQSHTRPSPDTEQTSDFRFSSSDCNDVKEAGRELEVKGLVSDNEDCISPVGQTDLLKETEKDAQRIDVKGKEETKSEWITVGLAGKMEGSQSHVPDACFIRAPMGVAEVLRCEVADAFSCLIVTGSEELVSRVIRVAVHGRANFQFPVTVVVPFCTRYRGSYRDVAVKIFDGERRASYVTPVSTEGSYGGQRGSFAEVRVYSLGLFAVVSCLKRENYTVPRRGLSLKLPMDPRICLNYLPGAFTAPVMAQTMIQPVDAVLLATVRSRSDVYYSVVSTSPLLYLVHPTTQPLRRPLTVTLPCPPNPEKKRDIRGQGEETEHQTCCLSPAWDQLASHRLRILGASLKSPKETSKELLIVLGSRDKQWSVLERVTVRNQQNGLASFELTENFERLLVVRLLSPLQPCHLTSLAEELEGSVGCHTVTVVLQCRQDEPHTVLVAALPSRDLSWELNRLRAQGYSGLPETSSDISMCEGDQLLLRFSGNIASTGAHNDQNHVPHERIAFHSQRTNHLLVRLTEVDPFGNYSSPHYKGTAAFYKVTRSQLEWRGDKAVPKDIKLLGDPVCKLSLTLPKKVRSINRPITTRVMLCEETDSLSDSLLLWLAGELSEEEIALLVLSLRLRRSAAQLVKLRAGGNLSTQAFHVLAMWRRGLPAAPHQPKASQLAHCLAKSGRQDLARELLLRQAAATRQGSLK
ncbi:death domain-containing protein 1 [Xiphias gladius]|uniref:death domain-containing protein 1 n=1 Tax=Xiphias gladius TaxID=8245 RepID=UPI001A992E5E|nr:death domain-containing protein 1 [Xiphias gladius]